MFSNFIYLVSVLSIVPQISNQRLSFLCCIIAGFQSDIYKGGIMDKTGMCEAASRTGRHNSPLWV
jgi:hypothetical protein